MQKRLYFFSDSDDEYLPDKLNKQYEHIKRKI